MYNHLKRCLITVIRTHNKMVTQSIRDVSFKTNVYFVLNNASCKRFYCQIPVQKEDDSVREKTDQSKVHLQINDAQQKFDEFLSDSENKRLFQILELEIDVMRHNAEKIPTKLDPSEWLHLLSLTSRTQRMKYLMFLWRNEIISKNKKAKQELKSEKFRIQKAEMEKNAENTGEILYGLGHNTLFLRIYETTINHYYNNRLIQAMLYEPKIVFDCDYEDYMTSFENHNCAKQLTLAFGSNRIHPNPMFLYFCNLKKEGLLLRNFHRNMPNLLNDDFPAVVTSQSYLDLFPKEKLVYLTPHCRTDMTEYDPDMIYIIGAMVDKSNSEPLSLAKAKKEGIHMAKFPIEKYLDWGSGSTKNLTLNQVLSILLDLRHTRDWKKALKSVPVRKLREFREYMLQKKLTRFLSSKDTKTQENTTVTNFTFSSRKKSEKKM